MLKRKVWVGISLVAGVTVGAAAGAAPEFPGGNFSAALKKVLAGEGGEGGIGISKMSNQQVTIPALSGANVKEALSGNTLRQNDLFALHFRADGGFNGWEVKWEKVDKARCAANAGNENYDVEDGVCWFATTLQQKGTWSTKGDQLCTQPALVAASGGSSCVSVALVLDRFALFNDKGDMIGKGNTLVPGENLEE